MVKSYQLNANKEGDTNMGSFASKKLTLSHPVGLKFNSH